MADKIVIRIKDPQSSKPPGDLGERQITVYYWHRIIPAVLILALVLIGVVMGIRHWLHSPVESDHAVPVAEVAQSATAEPVPLPVAPQVSKPVIPPHEKPLAHSHEPTVAKTAEQTTTMRPVIQAAGVRRLQLALDMANGQPGRSIDGPVPMNEKGLLKIFLYMETAGLKGRLLFHDWYWKDRLIAHARVPINRESQTAVTSKYIDRIMVGPWRVVVVDDHKKVLGETSFEVQ